MGRKRKLETIAAIPMKCQKISDMFSLASSQRNECAITVENDVPSTSSANVVLLGHTPIVLTQSEHQHTPRKTPTVTGNPVTPTTKGRKFRDEWKYGRPWLEYDAKTKLMFCQVCRRAQVDNSFTTGCSVMKKENVTTHLTGKGDNSHIAAEKVLASGNDFRAAQAKHIKKCEESVTGAMNNIYFMAKHSLPNSIFGDLNELCIKQGCESLRDLKVDRHTNTPTASLISRTPSAVSYTTT